MFGITKSKYFKTILIVIVFLSVIGSFYIYKSESQGKELKYIFLFIGDGLGTAQIQMTADYLGTMENEDIVKPFKLNLMKFPVLGMAMNYDLTSYIPDSASSGCAIASGFLCTPGKQKKRI